MAKRRTKSDKPNTYDSPDDVQKVRAERWDELYRQRRHAEDVLERHLDELCAHPDVTGVHVGLHRSENRYVKPLKYCIRVHVAKKRPPGHPELLLRIHDFIEDVEIDIHEASYRTAMAQWDGQTVDGGLPIAPAGAGNEFGTLGGVVFVDDLPRYITNQHVVGSVGNGVRVFGKMNGEPIGTVVASVSRVEGDNDLDVALIAPTIPPDFGFDLISPTNAELLASNAIFTTRTLTDADKFQTRCFKIGAKTGSPAVVGVVEDVNTRIRVGPDGSAGTFMSGQIIVKPESPGVSLIQEGDSGSLLITRVPKPGIELYVVVGLVHGMRDDGAIIACHFNRICDRLHVRLS
jgi:hypothetical protein